MQTKNTVPPTEARDAADPDIRAQIDQLEESLDTLIARLDQFHASHGVLRTAPLPIVPGDTHLPLALRVREFEEADRPALRLLYVASRNATFTWNPIDGHRADDFDAHTQGERILVAESHGRILGFASIWEADSFVHLLFVHPAFTRMGIGRALLTRSAACCATHPTLKCLAANHNAVTFYHAQGWQTLREETGPEGPFFLMTKT